MIKKYIIPDQGIIIDIPVTDEFVSQNWRKWEPVLDEAATDIDINEEWSQKRKILATMRKRKQHVVDRVYSTYHDEFTILVDFKTGKVGHFNSHDFRMELRGNKIFLRHINSLKSKLVYDGDLHTTSGSWLMSSSARLGCKHYLGIEWVKKKGFRSKSLYVKDHQLISVLYFGEQAISAIGKKSKLEINHRNLDHYDNRPDNLELITKKENSAHSFLMYRLLEEKISELFGLIDTGVWLHKTRFEV
ncbi:HNH endonuclease [Paenibacillus piri]|uniref:HNH nuclease domain-containing protein n=1 Tax=Paenibacillus piri TaxID=2547395 RepID=A0A4R5KXU4_9BACL|nr:HNH endonuclease [Paenibacillus piri]TDG00874.1 hypothetical protein E1757_04490 [Paenibacillus piri]